MVTKCLDLYVSFQLDATPTTTSFELWRSKGQQNIFVVVIKFLFAYWKTRHVMIGLFEADDIIGARLAKQLKVLLEKLGLTSKVLCYVKNKGTNLETMTIALKSTISCEALNLPIRFVGTCFGHALSKTSQYSTKNDKVSKDLGIINIRFAQLLLQAYITCMPQEVWYIDNLDLGIVSNHRLCLCTIELIFFFHFQCGL